MSTRRSMSASTRISGNFSSIFVVDRLAAAFEEGLTSFTAFLIEFNRVDCR